MPTNLNFVKLLLDQRRRTQRLPQSVPFPQIPGSSQAQARTENPMLIGLVPKTDSPYVEASHFQAIPEHIAPVGSIFGSNPISMENPISQGHLDKLDSAHSSERSPDEDEKTLFFFGQPFANARDLRECAEKYGFKKLCLVEQEIEGTRTISELRQLRNEEGGNLENDFDFICPVDYWHTEYVLEAIEKNGPIPKLGDAIISHDDWHLPGAYEASAKYDIYPASMNIGFRPHDKLQQRERLSAKGVDEQPKYQQVDIRSDMSVLQDALEKIGTPAVLKNLKGEGGRAIYPIMNPAELEKAVGEARKLKWIGYGLSAAGSVGDCQTYSNYLLEEYIPHEEAKEYDVQGVVFNGNTMVLGAAEVLPDLRLRDRDKRFDEIGEVNVPFDTPEMQSIAKSTSDWISALEYPNGPFNLALMRNQKDGENKFLEVNYRPSGAGLLFAKAYH